jgi:hypothetical protein
MKSPLTLFRRQQPAAPAECAEAEESRLDRIVGRQRDVNTSARLGRLSQQKSDPAEESPNPLYGPDAYGGHEPQL